MKEPVAFLIVSLIIFFFAYKHHKEGFITLNRWWIKTIFRKDDPATRVNYFVTLYLEIFAGIVGFVISVITFFEYLYSK